MTVFKLAEDNLLERIQNARSLLKVVKENEANRIKEDETKIYKGIFYVILYGAIERCMVDCVSICINYLNGNALKVADVKPELWALAFNPDCTRIEQNSNNKKWGNRNQLFARLYGGNSLPAIGDDLFPTSIGNIKMKQIEGIWNTFGIKEPMNPDLSKGYDKILSSVVDYRMQIAHGRRTSSEIGASCTALDMQQKFDAVNFYCNYVISCFENYVANEDFRIS